MADLSFAKYEGLGNDFIVVDGPQHAPQHATADAAPWLSSAQVRWLCDRHRGVGADGVLIVSLRGGRARMDVINADGSEPEMCGNGIRCVVQHLLRSGRASGRDLEIDTAAGPHRCRVLDEGGRTLVEVAMRPASLAPAEIGVLGALSNAPLLDAPLRVGDTTLHVTAVSMGNPHAVTFDAVGERAAVLGPLLEKHPSFARGVNAGFARMHGPQRIELAVYERGVGFTQACGTGACAAAVAAVETGRATRGTPLEVELPGGCLRIVVPEPGQRVLMTGPVQHVFDGRVELR